MNIRDLKYLTAVAKYKHFGKAAKACYVSQPALSMQISKLEDELGVKLIERNNKKLLITDVGHDIIERANKIISDADEIKQVAKSYQDPFSGDFKFGSFPTLAPYIFPQIIPKITKSYPNLKLLLIEEKTDILLDKLSKGQIDCALLALPINNNYLESQILFNDEFYLAVPSDHHLASKQDVSYLDMQNEDLLLLEDGHCLRDQALKVCSLTGLSEKTDFKATSMETLRQMVIAKVGITLVPKTAKKDNDTLTYLRFNDTTTSRTIAMVWRKTSAKKQCIQSVCNLIKL